MCKSSLLKIQGATSWWGVVCSETFAGSDTFTFSVRLHSLQFSKKIPKMFFILSFCMCLPPCMIWEYYTLWNCRDMWILQEQWVLLSTETSPYPPPPLFLSHRDQVKIRKQNEENSLLVITGTFSPIPYLIKKYLQLVSAGKQKKSVFFTIVRWSVSTTFQGRPPCSGAVGQHTHTTSIFDWVFVVFSWFCMFVFSFCLFVEF